MCWKDPTQNQCYAVTEGNLNWWATLIVRAPLNIRYYSSLTGPLQVKDPVTYSAEKKPLEINVYGAPPRSRAPGREMAVSQPPPLPPMGFPYAYYPPPYAPMPPWYSQPPPSSFNPVQPAPALAPTLDRAATKPTIKVSYPQITTWLAYCDRHADRRGEDFSALASKFDKEGFRRLNQLTGARVTVEKLSEWLNIGKGTADLLMGYAEEDVELCKAGNFTMAFADGADFDQAEGLER